MLTPQLPLHLSILIFSNICLPDVKNGWTSASRRSVGALLEAMHFKAARLNGDGLQQTCLDSYFGDITFIQYGFWLVWLSMMVGLDGVILLILAEL